MSNGFVELPRSRFVIGSVTGYNINRSGSVPWSGGSKTVWYVYDTEYCHRVVGRFQTRGDFSGRMAAQLRARELNVKDRRRYGRRSA